MALEIDDGTPVKPDADSMVDRLMGIDLEGWVIDNEDGTKTLKLEYPIEVKTRTSKGESVSEVPELHLSRPKGIHLDMLEQAGKGSAMAGVRRYACALTPYKGHAQKLSEQIDGADMFRLIAAAMSFLPIRPSRTASADGDSQDS